MEKTPKKEKILIIEGSGAFGERIVDLLKSDGYENVFLVKNGIDGLKSIYDFLPHLVLMDVVLPGQSGYDILAKKQAEPLLAKIPVFLMSTQGIPIIMKNVPQGSVTEYIMFMYTNPDIIVGKINRHFGYEEMNEVDLGNVIIEKESNKTKLLWVEDDKLIGKILGKQFIAADFELFHAHNGDEAMKYLKTNIPRVIVVDLLLPGMSGFDVLQNIKKDSGLREIPTMVLSNLSKASDIEKAKALGARKFLVKSAYSLDQIVLEVKSLCR